MGKVHEDQLTDAMYAVYSTYYVHCTRYLLIDFVIDFAKASPNRV